MNIADSISWKLKVLIRSITFGRFCTPPGLSSLFLAQVCYFLIPFKMRTVLIYFEWNIFAIKVLPIRYLPFMASSNENTESPNCKRESKCIYSNHQKEQNLSNQQCVLYFFLPEFLYNFSYLSEIGLEWFM